MFLATSGSRSVTWEEHEDGRVSACEFCYWDNNGSVQVNSWGIFKMALSKGYKLPVPDLLLGQLAESVKIGGPVFENVSALLTLCGIPLDAERLPMRRGAVSLSP